MHDSSDNPFRIGEHVTGYHFANRDAELAHIRSAILSGSTSLVYGPRRMGKSSTIINAAALARTAKPKPIIVSVDVSTATNLYDVSARLLRSLYAETRWLKLRLEDILGGLAPRVSVTLDEHGGPPSITFGLDRRTASEAERQRAFESVIARFAQIRKDTDRRVAIVFDEFQAVSRFAGETSEWHLRDVIQRNTDLAFICAGSQESLIHELIGPKRAFYKMFDLLPLGPIDTGFFADWLEERLARASKVATGVGHELLRLVGPRTQDVIQVARQLYFRALTARRNIDLEDVSQALNDVVRSETPLLRSLWNDLSAQQQDVLRVIALDVQQLYSAEVRDQYALPGSSSVSKAVETLAARGLVVKDSDRIEFDSPFFRQWVRNEVASDLGL